MNKMTEGQRNKIKKDAYGRNYANGMYDPLETLRKERDEQRQNQKTSQSSAREKLHGKNQTNSGQFDFEAEFGTYTGGFKTNGMERFRSDYYQQKGAKYQGIVNDFNGNRIRFTPGTMN